MSSLSSASTLTQIKDSYFDNASYEEDASPTKARAFITACRFLLLKLPKRIAHGGRGSEEIELTPELVQKQLEQARQWVAVNDTASHGGGVRLFSLEDFRD